jgi:hypothetical protein
MTPCASRNSGRKSTDNDNHSHPGGQCDEKDDERDQEGQETLGGPHVLSGVRRTGGDKMTQHAKAVLDKWVFRAIWVVLFVTVAGFVVKLFEVI